MPNRLIKESICTSEDLDKLSAGAEILFYRLIVQADDFGRYFGNPSIVKSNCFPLKDEKIHSAQVDSWLDELEKAGLITRYSVDGRKYVFFCKWDKHQNRRAKESKFPAPDNNCNQMQADASKCNQMSPYSYSYSNSYSNNVLESEKTDDGFEAFWNAYPKKSGDIRQAYFEYEGAVQNGTKPEEILEAVKAQAAAKEQRYFPSAEKWLRNKGWTEKISEGKIGKAAPQKALTADEWDKVMDRI